MRTAAFGYPQPIGVYPIPARSLGPMVKARAFGMTPYEHFRTNGIDLDFL
ncbi:MAG TPA: hypothetical protein VKB49_20380 [Candidatus Sulfotelmatobacter sp.]|nr:hypothetical protein [Candidatus Sulfotelmatobacter sp.]